MQVDLALEVLPRVGVAEAVQLATRTRAEWCALLEGSDACFAPVLNPDEAANHPHMAARGVYQVKDGVLQAAPAPRFSAMPLGEIGPVPRRGGDREAILADWLERAGAMEDGVAAE